MVMPAGENFPGKTAGPGFGLTRHVMLPPDAANARRLCTERLRELADIAARLVSSQVPDPVKRGCAHLQQISKTF